MTRRVLFLVPLVAIAQPDTPRNRLCMAANQFQEQYLEWAQKMNRKVGTVDAGAVEAWERLPEMWRKVEKAWRNWLT